MKKPKTILDLVNELAISQRQLGKFVTDLYEQVNFQADAITLILKEIVKLKETK